MKTTVKFMKILSASSLGERKENSSGYMEDRKEHFVVKALDWDSGNLHSFSTLVTDFLHAVGQGIVCLFKGLSCEDRITILPCLSSLL